MERKQVEIDYVPYMNAYRIYDANKPERTFAYVDTLEEATTVAKEYRDGTYILYEN
jgi:hypothetical protein